MKIEATTQGMNLLINVFPQLRYGAATAVAVAMRKHLESQYLSGSPLRYRGFGRDSIKRRKVSAPVNKRTGTITIHSYPLNLFERGRELRSGKREPGKYILTRKLKGDAGTVAPAALSKYLDNKIKET